MEQIPGLKLPSGVHIFPAAARSWADVSELTVGEGKLE